MVLALPGDLGVLLRVNANNSFVALLLLVPLRRVGAFAHCDTVNWLQVTRGGASVETVPGLLADPGLCVLASRVGLKVVNALIEGRKRVEFPVFLGFRAFLLDF